MFSTVISSSSQRITEISEYLNFIAAQIPLPPVSPPRSLNAAKGMVFVQLYGAIEHTVSATISLSILKLNSESLKLSHVKPILLGLALDAEFNAIFGVTRKKWDKRHDLLKQVELDVILAIPSDVLPTDGRNIRHPQLESIWKTFCLTDPIFHNVTFRGRLEDIVTNRNNIAHGIESASDVGGRVTISDLQTRVSDVSAFCSYFISVFDDYFLNRKFEK